MNVEWSFNGFMLALWNLYAFFGIDPSVGKSFFPLKIKEFWSNASSMQSLVKSGIFELTSIVTCIVPYWMENLEGFENVFARSIFNLFNFSRWYPGAPRNRKNTNNPWTSQCCSTCKSCKACKVWSLMVLLMLMNLKFRSWTYSYCNW